MLSFSKGYNSPCFHPSLTKFRVKYGNHVGCDFILRKVKQNAKAPGHLFDRMPGPYDLSRSYAIFNSALCYCTAELLSSRRP